MQISKENNHVTSSRKRHNPKSHAPAVYIPCWLIQIPQNELSHLAKILYGRLAQWSNTKGYVSRSAPELGAEMGCHPRVIERGLKELRDVGLIETYQPQKGGVNSFIFLDHEFMHRPLQDCLDYYESHSPSTRVPSSVESAPVDNSIPTSMSEGKPHDKNVGTPTTKMSVPPDKNVGLKYKEIKENKKSKSFCADAAQKANSEQPKSKTDWKAENEKVHSFAESMNNAAQSKDQMANEAKHIEEHEARKREEMAAPRGTAMPESLREFIRNMKVTNGGANHDRPTEGRGMQKSIV
jgi:hypothetical protein